jgi:hypothetical protein
MVFSFFYVETIRGSTYISRAERCQMRRKIGFQVMWNDFSRKKLETRSLRTFFTADHLLAPRPPPPRHLPITAALTPSVLEWRLRPNFAISRISSRLVLITHLTHSHRDTLIYLCAYFSKQQIFDTSSISTRPVSSAAPPLASFWIHRVERKTSLVFERSEMQQHT